MENGNFPKNDIFEPMNPNDEPISLNVPTPLELPERINVESLPSHIIRSGAVESLVHQNEDLMARLSVNLRRISKLEEQVLQYQKTEKEIRFKYETFQDQVLILREKSKAVEGRNQRHENKYNKVKEQLQVLQVKYTEEIKEFEIRLAEAYQRSSKESLILQGEIKTLAKRVRRLKKYQNSISPIAKSLKSRNKELLAQIELDKNILTKQMERETTKLSSEIEELEFQLTDLKSKLAETTNYIQSQAKTHKTQQQELIDNYESNISALNKELNSHKEKSQNHQKTFDRNIDLENNLVVLERRSADLKIKHEEEINQVQSALVDYRSQAKKNALELEQVKKDFENANFKADQLEKANGKLTDQVESLQCLWKDNQSQLEHQTERNKALQKLNQQLSTSLNQYRKEVKELKEQADQQGFKTTSQVNDLQKQLKAAVEISKQSFVETHSENAEDPEKFHPDLMNKIDQLIIEIQSGFDQKPE